MEFVTITILEYRPTINPPGRGSGGPGEQYSEKLLIHLLAPVGGVEGGGCAGIDDGRHARGGLPVGFTRKHDHHIAEGKA